MEVCRNLDHEPLPMRRTPFDELRVVSLDGRSLHCSILARRDRAMRLFPIRCCLSPPRQPAALISPELSAGQPVRPAGGGLADSPQHRGRPEPSAIIVGQDERSRASE